MSCPDPECPQKQPLIVPLTDIEKRFIHMKKVSVVLGTTNFLLSSAYHGLGHHIIGGIWFGCFVANCMMYRLWEKGRRSYRKVAELNFLYQQLHTSPVCAKCGDDIQERNHARSTLSPDDGRPALHGGNGPSTG
jgi:hypothetical protein